MSNVSLLNYVRMIPNLLIVSRMVSKQRMPSDNLFFQMRENFRCSVAAWIKKLCWETTDNLLLSIRPNLIRKRKFIFGYQGNNNFCPKLPMTWKIKLTYSTHRQHNPCVHFRRLLLIYLFLPTVISSPLHFLFETKDLRCSFSFQLYFKTEQNVRPQ